tara:strand:- start:298 stop:474 length:177 start_codon:yes stop_codon:yes gene_type:complete
MTRDFLSKFILTLLSAAMKVAGPVSARYAWAAATDSTLNNKAGLATSLFRAGDKLSNK